MPVLVRELVEWLREETATHPVLVAGVAQFQLVHIHPFVDGDGRTSRLIEGLSPQLVEVRDRGEHAIRADVIARERGLNARQSVLLSAFIARRPMTLADCEALLPDVVRRTVQRDLRGLVDKGLLREVGRGPTGPTRHYVLAEL